MRGQHLKISVPIRYPGDFRESNAIARHFRGAVTEDVKRFGKASQLTHLGISTAEDQAALMVYLAGPHGQRITGQAISGNGGISSA